MRLPCISSPIRCRTNISLIAVVSPTACHLTLARIANYVGVELVHPTASSTAMLTLSARACDVRSQVSYKVRGTPGGMNTMTCGHRCLRELLPARTEKFRTQGGKMPENT
ncbi:hypothetical protein PISMIDRAFT_670513 [Pisolithus microcarpus 441]|uniref:Uncharacterized protein n=1 Tax=Pisolithus microcarpus 441 TaxID=765257 RepID=A0A0C9ZM07_9AGAM|nr:hypothetical protein PISMIDRAFT_670513 [Pisolithus microcarpus 441]